MSNFSQGQGNQGVGGGLRFVGRTTNLPDLSTFDGLRERAFEDDRRDLKPLFESFFERGEKDYDILTREDLDYFFDSVHCPPTSHYDLESLYSAEEIEAWQERSKEEDEPEMVEEFILKNVNCIPKNDPCPCGSGKKYRKCHLLWAEQELARLREEEFLN